SQPEHHEPLVLRHDPDGPHQDERCDDDGDEDPDPHAARAALSDQCAHLVFSSSLPGTGADSTVSPPTGVTRRRRPSAPTTRTRFPLGIDPATESAVQLSEATCAAPRGVRAVVTTPSRPTRFLMWMVGARLLTRNAACTANPKNPTAARATGTMTPGDTRALGTDGLNRKSPPRTSVITPAAVNTPMPGAFNSRRKKAADATSNATPTSWTGSMPNDTNAA